MGDVNDQEQPAIEPGAAGAPEGAVAEPTAAEIKELYEATGVKAPVPTGKAKGRPKAADVRAEDDAKKGAGDSKAGKQGNDDSKGKSKNASADDKDGDSGDNSDSSGKKVGKDSGKVSDESEDADEGVHGSKSRAKEDSERGGEGDSDDGTDGTGQAADESKDSEEEGEDAEKGKRPGKSNPEIEKRFQKLTSDVRERDEEIAALREKLQKSTQEQFQIKASAEDPEYTIEDFRTVRDNATGEIIELDAEKAELAWRRWKDGYDQRAVEREARFNHESAAQARQEAITQQLMKDSVEAYDALAALMDEYPELVSTSGQFDEDFANEAMPIIQDSIEYLPGTEPGNPEDKLPIITGLKLHPKKILTALKNISNKKRNLPLNGVNDNVERGSNVNVPHGRSSDPTINAANELYKELGIKKRI